MNKPMMRFSGFDDEWGISIFNSDMYERISTGPYKIKTEEYCSIGEYPIVDQGKELVVGYHNETANVIGVDDSVIIFGDHTRIFKYIDFDFVPGADGIQVIKLNSNYDTLFVYNRFLLMDIPNMGYSRHFKFLMNRRIKHPSLPEQKLIGNFFKTIDDLISAQEETVEAYELYKEAMLQKMFPKKGKNLPEVRFDGFDDKWEEKKLGDIVSVETGKLDANAMVEGGKYPYFTCAEETYRIDNYSFDGEALLIAGNGVIGLTKYYNGKFNAYQRTYVLMGYDNLRFLNHYLSLKLPERIHVMTSGSTMPYITMGVLSDMGIMLPSKEEQELIGNFFKIIDELIAKQEERVENGKLLKKALLQKMFV